MPCCPRPCAWRALALVALLLLGPRHEQSSFAAAARSRRATAGLHVHRHAADPGDSGSPGPGDDDTGASGSILSERSMRRLAAVNSTLHDILLSIDSDEKEEATNFMKLMQWCETQVPELKSQLEKVQANVQQGEVAKQELEATVSETDHQLKELNAEIESATDEETQASDLDNEDDGNFAQDLSLNSQAISQVDQAIEIVSKVTGQGGFLQNGLLRRLQINQPGEASYVLGILKRMKIGLEQTREKMLGSQHDKQEASAELHATKHEQLVDFRGEQTGKFEALTQAKTDLVEAERHLKHAQDKVPVLEKRLAENQAHCDAKMKSWKARTVERAKEKAAIQEAITYILQNAKEMGLTGSKGQSAGNSDADMLFQAGENHRQQQPDLLVSAPPVFLQVNLPKHASMPAGALRGTRALAALDVAALAKSGSSDTDIKQVVQDLATVLKDQQKQEAAMMEQCRAGLAKQEGEQGDVQDHLSTLNASINYLATEIDTISTEVTQIYQELEKLNKTVFEARTMRYKEQQTYEAHTRDRNLARRVLRQAEAVLRQFYSSVDESTPEETVRQKKPSFLQQANLTNTTTQPRPTVASGSTRKTRTGYAVLDLLESIRDEIAEEQRNADSDEQDAVAAFEKLEKDSRIEFDESMGEITDRMKRKGAMTVKLNSASEERTHEEEDLKSVQAQAKSVHQRCDDLMKHFEERQKARAFELDQLQDVVDILSGSQIAVRTGLLEELSQPLLPPAQQQ